MQKRPLATRVCTSASTLVTVFTNTEQTKLWCGSVELWNILKWRPRDGSSTCFLWRRRYTPYPSRPIVAFQSCRCLCIARGTLRARLCQWSFFNGDRQISIVALACYRSGQQGYSHIGGCRLRTESLTFSVDIVYLHGPLPDSLG